MQDMPGGIGREVRAQAGFRESWRQRQDRRRSGKGQRQIRTPVGAAAVPVPDHEAVAGAAVDR
ncbi:hypothetical protein GCM10010321_52870 [Streptomyces chartreusis]|nr:hypothetical protein CP983_42130 [Streptomyces chartreusis]GGX31326.1 hypothetical protein GCM10010321_52870 [Streptomyces chartreusis]